MIDLRQGDCLELMKDIPDASIDMILADLPYGVLNQTWDKIIDFKKLWEHYNRIIKPKGAILLFGNEPFASLIRTSQMDKYKYDWYWQKEKPSNFQIMNYQPGRVIETISVFSKAGASFSKGNEMTYYPIKTPRNKPRTSNVKVYGDYDKNILNKNSNFTKDNIKTYKDKHPINLLEFKNVTGKVHPTQKPVELLEYLIKTYTNKGDLVLDNVMGSGSTGVACVNTNRSFIGIELDENYFNIAKERIENII